MATRRSQPSRTSYMQLVLITTAALVATPTSAETEQRAKTLERVTVIGTEDLRTDIPGAATIVGTKSLEKHGYTDVHRALQEVPGVTIQEEDGYGLRPNIAIRGGRSNRSADLTLMEDGILAAPAPYAAPEAYYFPQLDRMESLEVIKGTGAVKYGPRTTNGVLNLVTKPIPAGKQAALASEFGSHSSIRTGLTGGTSFEHGGFLLNAVHKEAEGFKEIDFVGGNTGYSTQDVIGKLRLNSGAGASRYQEVELKLGWYNERSNETYLGLTDADFAGKSNRRYAASQLDEMNVAARQLAASHYIELAPKWNLTTSIYRNEVDRSWYKLDSVRLSGVSRSLSTIFDNQTANAAYLAALKAKDTSGGTFTIRDNNREYRAFGAQSTLATQFALGTTDHRLEVGFRYHTDEEDRFQRDDRFDLVDGRAVLVSTGAPGAAGNRVQSAAAWSGFVQHELRWGGWSVTPGVRFEHINLKREDYGSSDPQRTGANLSVFENDLNIWIPGVGVSYAVTDTWRLLAGVHKGFAPPGVPGNANEAAFTSEEESVNYELGTRYAAGNWSGELFFFLTDYDNLLGRDTLSSGGGGTGDAFNGGKVEVKGLEASAGYNAASLVGLAAAYRLPLTATYTFTEGEFQSSFASSFEEWGNVTAGDKLPYLPRHQLALSAGFEAPQWQVSVTGRFTDDMRTRAGRGAIPDDRRVASHWTVDLAGEYRFNDNIKAFATVKNLLDETYIAARRPAGARSGLPLTALVGAKVSVW